MRIFLDDLSWNWWTEAEHLLHCGWASSIPLKDAVKQRKKEFTLFSCLWHELGHFISSSPVPRIHTISSLLQGVMVLDWVTPLALPGLSLAGMYLLLVLFLWKTLMNSLFFLNKNIHDNLMLQFLSKTKMVFPAKLADMCPWENRADFNLIMK